MNTVRRGWTDSGKRRIVILSFIVLSALALSAGHALAHNVTEGDAGYIQEIWGVNIIPFRYLGAKHMVKSTRGSTDQDLCELVYRPNGPTVFAPFRQTAVKATGVEAILAQERHGLVGVDAVWATAVGHDLGVSVQGRHKLLERRDRHVDCARNVGIREFVGRANVEDRYGPSRQSGVKLLATDRFGRVLAAREPTQDLPDPGEVPVGNDAQDFHQLQRPCVRQSVDHRLAVPAAGDKAGTPKLLQMLRAVRHGEAGLVRQRFHPTLALGQLFKKHEPPRGRQRPRDQGVFFEKGHLGVH